MAQWHRVILATVTWIFCLLAFCLVLPAVYAAFMMDTHRCAWLPSCRSALVCWIFAVFLLFRAMLLLGLATGIPLYMWIMHFYHQ